MSKFKNLKSCFFLVHHPRESWWPFFIILIVFRQIYLLYIGKNKYDVSCELTLRKFCQGHRKYTTHHIFASYSHRTLLDGFGKKCFFSNVECEVVQCNVSINTILFQYRLSYNVNLSFIFHLMFLHWNSLLFPST